MEYIIKNVINNNKGENVKMNVNLYELTNEFVETLDGLNDLLEEGTITEKAYDDTIETLKMPLEEKVESIVKYIKNLEAIADSQKSEADRLRNLASGNKAKAARLKTYLDSNLKRAGIKNMQAGIFSVKYKKGSEVVTVSEDVDFNKLPKEIVKIKKEVSKTEAKKLLKEGKTLPGVALVRNPDALVIK